MLRRRPELLVVQDRADAVRPQAVGGARPAKPAVEAQVGERDGVAVDAGEADAPLAAVGEGARRVVTGGAGALAVSGEARVEEQLPPERDRGRVAGDAIAGVAIERRRPRPVRQDRRALGVAEGGGRLVSRHQGADQRAATGDRQRGKAGDGGGGFHGFRVMSRVSRVRLSPWNRSNVSRQVPGMCSISPVKRKRPGPVSATAGR